MTEQLSSFEGIELTASDESIITNVITTTGDPSSGGLVAPVGSLALSDSGRGYYKHNTANTDWVTIFTQLPGELASLLTAKGSASLGDRLIIEDSTDSFNKKFVTVQEIVALASGGGGNSQDMDFSRRGNLSAITTLLTRDGILSSNSGYPISVSNPTLQSVNVSTRLVASYTLRIFQHDGNSTNRIELADIVATNTANLRAEAGIDFTVLAPLSPNSQLGVELSVGGARDIMVDVRVLGS